MLNVSAYGSHAIIVSAENITAIPLEALTPENLISEASRFLAATDVFADSTAPVAKKRAAQELMLRTLGWLWESIADQVADELGLCAPGDPVSDAERRLPRIWWCPTGLLTFLPLHAAGRYPSAGGPPVTLMDHAISSYTPTIRMLYRARSRAIASAPASVLAVAVPDAPEMPHLPATTLEAATVVRTTGRGEALIGPDAVREQVLSRLSLHPWVHFACHAKQEVDNPSNARLMLYDEPLTVIDISREAERKGDLAFLSACNTTRGGLGLTDEALHLSSAFQLAGYPHVIGTMWELHDKVAVEIAEEVYRHLGQGFPGDVPIPNDSFAQALHSAIRTTRANYPQLPWLWASHIHLGP